MSGLSSTLSSGAIASNTGAKPKKSVHSLLGEHSNLVNLDNLVTDKKNQGKTFFSTYTSKKIILKQFCKRLLGAAHHYYIFNEIFSDSDLFSHGFVGNGNYYDFFSSKQSFFVPCLTWKICLFISLTHLINPRITYCVIIYYCNLCVLLSITRIKIGIIARFYV